MIPQMQLYMHHYTYM